MALTPSTMLELGTSAPEFSLVDTDGNRVRLSDFTGALAVVLVVRYLGRADASDRGLRRALLFALLASLAAAGLSTIWDRFIGDSPWPF